MDNCLLRHIVKPYIRQLGKIDQKNQYGIYGGEHHAHNCRDFAFFAAFVIKTSRHHNIADRQEHADKVCAKVKAGQQTYGKQENRR